MADYFSPNAADIPDEFKDPEGYWIGFGGMARLILVNTEVLKDRPLPDSIYSLLDEQYPANQVGLAYPMFGTTATHAAALYAALGEVEARRFFKTVSARKVSLVDGNSVVRDRVAGGQWLSGLMDTDDACGAIQRNAPVKAIFPDQGEGGLGTLIIPNTVGLVAGGPHPEEGKKLIDYLLSLEVEARLVEMGWSHFPTRPVQIEPRCFGGVRVKKMQDNLEEVYHQIERIKEELGEVFIR